MKHNASQWYETRRNELLGLLDEATKLDIPEKYGDELRQTARKCQEDAFEIALVGEFQGGKSTTFNALCDGRDISPRGLCGGGIKTSAAVISVQNIADNETKDGLSEWAEVECKTKEAIALSLSTILRSSLLESNEFRAFNEAISDEEFATKMSTDDGFPALVDLDNRECREILLAAAQKVWEKWERDKANALDSDQLDQLRIATVQLRFYGSQERKTLADKQCLAIDQFQRLVAFPKDWAIRWTHGFSAEFRFEEIAFVFVHKVLVRIHSENLKRLGCRITDCPGLFANAFDTAVAERAIRNADAVWYLIFGDKQLGDKDSKAIKQIMAWGLEGKIQATANIHSDWDVKSTDILSATKSTLFTMGLPLDVVPYNARLAFLAAQGDLLVKHPERVSEMDRKNMTADYRPKDGVPTPDSSAMWTKMIRRIGSNMDLDDLATVSTLTSESVKTVRSASHLDDILTKLENDFIPQKARSILVDRGSERAAKALELYEGTLLATENAANAKKEEWKAKLEETRKQLATFVDRAKTIVDHSAFASEKDHLCRDMANDIVDRTLDDKFLDTLAYDISAVLRISARQFYLTRSKMEQDVVQKLGPVLTKDLQDSFSRAIENWKKESKKNSLARLHRSLNNVCADIHDLWEDRDMDSNDLLKGFETPTVSADDIADFCGEFSNEVLSNTEIGEIAEEGRRGLFTVLWDLTWPFILGVVGGMISFPLTVVAFVGKGLYDMTKSEEELEQEELEKIQREIGKIIGKVRPEIETAVLDRSFREGVSRPIVAQLEQAVETIEANIRSELDMLKTDFENSRVRETEKTFAKSDEERTRIADENKRIRIETIEPLRKRIEAFATAVSEEIAE